MNPLDALGRYPLFTLLGREALEAWVAAAVVQAVSTGETLFEAGTPGEWAYLVLEGGARVVKRGGGGRDVALGVFGPGELFGEYALLRPHLNTATCRSTGEGRLLRLPLRPVRAALAPFPGVIGNLKRWLCLDAMLGYLRERAFLGFVSADAPLRMLDRCRPMTFPTGHTIQADGLSESRWYFVRSGAVRLQPVGEGAASRLLRRGDCFGERALAGLHGHPTTVALAASECLALDRADFAPSAGGLSGVDQTRAASADRVRPYPWVGQQETADCGLAALAMIASYHGRPVSVEMLRSLVPIEERGVEVSRLLTAARRLGLAGQAVRLEPARVGELSLPAVAHLEEGHYVVVYAVGPAGVVFGDPASAVLTWTAELFGRACSGTFLVFKPARSPAQA